MKHFKIKKFNNEAKKVDLNDDVLMNTLNEFLKLTLNEQQTFSLGAGLYKLRIATKEGRGKSGGSRSVLALKEIAEFIGYICFLKMIKVMLVRLN